MFTADSDALAEERTGTSQRSRSAGFVGSVPKPFVVDESLATLRSAVQRPESAVELGTIVTGFCAIGAFDRGFDSARRKSSRVELEARNRAVVVAGAGTPAKVRQRDTRVA